MFQRSFRHFAVQKPKMCKSRRVSTLRWIMAMNMAVWLENVELLQICIACHTSFSENGVLGETSFITWLNSWGLHLSAIVGNGLKCVIQYSPVSTASSICGVSDLNDLPILGLPGMVSHRSFSSDSTVNVLPQRMRSWDCTCVTSPRAKAWQAPQQIAPIRRPPKKHKDLHANFDLMWLWYVLVRSFIFFYKNLWWQATFLLRQDAQLWNRLWDYLVLKLAQPGNIWQNQMT